MSESTSPEQPTDGFTPLTTEHQKLEQLLAWLQEHTTLFNAIVPAAVLQRPVVADGTDVAQSPEVQEWTRLVASARQQANDSAARLSDEISHAARMVLGAAADQTFPYQAFAEGKVDFTDVTVPVTARGWQVDSLPRNDGGEDAAPALAENLGAQTSVDVRIFTPSNPTGAAIIAAHGGSWWMGNGTCRDMLFGPDCAALAEVSGAVVLDVDYRLAPEYPLPAPVEDLLAVSEWARANANELGIDPAKLLLWGTSSGGHVSALTAAIAAKTAGNGSQGDGNAGTTLAPFAGLLLSMPAADLAGIRPDVLQAVYGQAVSDTSAFVSPVNIAAELMPPTHVQLAAHDEMVTGGEKWAAANTTTTTLLSTHIVATPKVQRERIVDLAIAALRLTGTERELPTTPDATYSAEAVDQANRESWGPILRPEDL